MFGGVFKMANEILDELKKTLKQLDKDIKKSDSKGDVMDMYMYKENVKDHIRSVRKKSTGRILNIRRWKWDIVEVEYFNANTNQTEYANRKVRFPSINSYSGAYIMWDGKKKIVESLYL